MNLLRRLFLTASDLGYQTVRPLVFRQNAQEAHQRVMDMLQSADEHNVLNGIARVVHGMAFEQSSYAVGGTQLRQPFILAAGFVKGYGFRDEGTALEIVEHGKNIMPGWNIMPRLVGLVEFGSFTRYPRIGNAGTVMWRDVAARSTQNRVGLKNPGAVAAATFLQKHIIDLPPQFGINIAVSPGVDDPEQDIQDVTESISAFLQRGVVPNWFTLNVSCPNTEDDPSGNQTDARTRRLCEAAIAQIKQNGYAVPLWVKLSPDLAEKQYRLLMRVFAETGVKAVIATNTLGQPTPDNTGLTAGVGGSRLYSHALQAASWLQDEKQRCDYPLDVVGCGGILTGDDYVRYKARGINVVQYWSAMVYRGPLAAAFIAKDLI